MNGLPKVRWLLIGALLTGCGAETASQAQQTPAPQVADAAAPAVSPPAAEPAAEPEEALPGQIDESAVSLLKDMTSKVAGLPAFGITLESGFEVLQESGRKLEFGSRRTAMIRRPNLARFTYEERGGLAGELVFDGAAITAFEREQNVYASIEQPGDIDTSIDLVTLELGIPVPVSDFFAADPGIALAEGVLEALDLGPSTIDQQPGRHIALRKPGVDYQIWINEDTRLPIRVVITYREEPGQPQFWAQFLQWDTDPELTESSFEFAPPEDAERIRFGVFDTAEAVGDDA